MPAQTATEAAILRQYQDWDLKKKIKFLQDAIKSGIIEPDDPVLQSVYEDSSQAAGLKEELKKLL